jgi:phosphoribosylanthranilate isomerase
LLKQHDYGRDGRKSQRFLHFAAIPGGLHGEPMIVQIYEIQTPEEARSMIALGVDHIGSVLLSAEKWQDNAIKQVVETVRSAGRKSSLIPLFSDPNLIAQVIRFYQPDIIHFCEAIGSDGRGNGATAMALERQTMIRRQFPEIQIMRTIPIAADGDHDRASTLELAAAFGPVSDWFLTDTVIAAGSVQDQPVSGFVGITGKACNWSAARKLVEASRIPVILAGGIGPCNVESAILQVHPAGVDSCTRTNAVDAEGKPVRFQKDTEKVAALVLSARKKHIFP